MIIAVHGHSRGPLRGQLRVLTHWLRAARATNLQTDFVLFACLASALARAAIEPRISHSRWMLSLFHTTSYR